MSNEDVEYWKNRAKHFESQMRVLANQKVVVHDDTMNTARFNIVRILIDNLDTQIRTMCFNDSIVSQGLKTGVLITLSKLKQEMNVEFEHGIFYYYSKSGDKLVIGGRDYRTIDSYNEDWMK